MDERELEGIKRTLGELAEALDEDGGMYDSDQVADMLRMVAQGKTSELVIAHHEIGQGL